MLLHDQTITQQLEQYGRITEQLIQQYRHDGFLILNDVIDDQLLKQVKEEIIYSRQQQVSVLDSWKYTKLEAIPALANDPSILSILEQIYQYPAFPFQTLNFQDSPAIGLHADVIHFSSEPYGYMCGVWIALEDCTMDNGPLQYFPSSHHLAPTYFEDINLKANKEQFKFNLGEYTRHLVNKVHRLKLEPLTLTCRRGTILIWDTNLLHCSIEPRANRTRYSQVTHYFFRAPNSKYLVPAYGKNYEKIDVFGFINYINRSVNINQIP